MRIEKLRFLDSGINNGYFNMALDEVLSNKVSENLSEPVLRFYQWDPACLSLGYFQKTELEIDFDGLKKHNVDLVRRQTGGRAVLHDHELTYSIILPLDIEGIGLSINESYKIISQGLLLGLQKLGLKPILQKPLEKAVPHTSSACFDAPSSYELLCNNKKIIGSAQKRFTKVLLQHGSIPLTMDVNKLFDCLIFENDDRKKLMKRYFSMKATSIFEVAQKEFPMDYIKECFLEGFKEAFSANIEYSELSEEEIIETSGMMTAKYSTDQWNILKNKQKSL